MKKALTSVVAAWTLLYGGLVPSVAQSPETPLKIEVHLYNYSGVTAEVLARAEQETARIYRRLGVEMEWRHCLRTAEELEQNPTCDLPASTTTLTVRLLSKEMAHRFPVGDDIYGFALLPLNQGFGVTANVFADRARDMAADDELHRVILGHLIAHELGHLLLGEAGHPACAGIMHVPWQTKELERIKQGAMFFLPEQAEKIRAQVLARMTSSNHSTAICQVLISAPSVLSVYTESWRWCRLIIIYARYLCPLHCVLSERWQAFDPVAWSCTRKNGPARLTQERSPE